MISINRPLNQAEQQLLPDEMFGEILRFLPYDDIHTLNNCSLVNKKFNEIITSDEIWAQIYFKKFTIFNLRDNVKIKTLYAERNRECNEELVVRTGEYVIEKLDYFTPEVPYFTIRNDASIRYGTRRNILNLGIKGSACGIEGMFCMSLLLGLMSLSFLVTLTTYNIFSVRNENSAPQNSTQSNYTTPSNPILSDRNAYFGAGLGLMVSNVICCIAFCFTSIFLKYACCWKGGAYSSGLTAKTVCDANRMKIKNNYPTRCSIL